MPMIDVGLKIEMSTAAVVKASEAKPGSDGWTQLKNCIAMPALIQPSAKIPTDYIGDEYTSELLGKKAITGLDFTFAFDGTATGSQFKKLKDADKNNDAHYFRVMYPDGTKFEFAADIEVSLVAPTPSGELQYVASLAPIKSTLLTEIIEIVDSAETDPLV